MANTYSDIGRFLQDAFSIDDTFTSKRRLNESKHKFNEDLDSMWIIVPTERRYDDLTASDYLEFARKYGTFNNQQDCFDRVTELAPDRWDAFIPMKLEGVNESFKSSKRSKKLNESVDATNQDIKNIAKKIEARGFKAHTFTDYSEISVYVPDSSDIPLVKEIVSSAAKSFGCVSTVENEGAEGDILFSFTRDESVHNIGKEEQEQSKQWFEKVLEQNGIDYQTALAFIVDVIDRDELEFITRELLKTLSK